jgi:hypothetical protein
MLALEVAGKASMLVILSEAKDLALSIFELCGPRFITNLRTPFRERTTHRLEKAQSKVLRFAQHDRMVTLFRERPVYLLDRAQSEISLP